jgi:hypothetical protein
MAGVRPAWFDPPGWRAHRELLSALGLRREIDELYRQRAVA